MFVLVAMVRDGTLPLLGPVTSFGDFHHGALWYYVLAPAAWLGNGDPTMVVAEIALLGSAAVGLVAALARSVAGPVAGIGAGSLMALSASAIGESTFFWNPNLVAFFSALAVWSAWRAWSSRNVRWWLLAAGAQAASMQCHVLGVILVPPLLAWFIADARRRNGADRQRIVRAGLASVVVVVLSYLPLIASELQTGFGEVRSVIDYVTQSKAAADQSAGQGLVFRLVFIPLRALSWPLTGLISDALVAGTLVAATILGFIGWLWRATGGTTPPFARWLGATILWSCLALVFAAPSLEFVTPLPVDHYHAFLDPLVFLVVGIGLGTLWSRAAPAMRTGLAVDGARVPDGPVTVPGRGLATGRALTPGRVLAGGLLVVLVAWNVAHSPPSTAPDGGYPAAEVAAARIATQVGDRVTLVESLPTFKSADAYTYPLERLGVRAHERLDDPLGLDSMVVICDSLFVRDCGGPAEDPQASIMRDPKLVDRFVAAPGRTISVYLGTPGG
jgi:hypothetical protein